MKSYEREEARRLRREEGMSVKDICKTLGVAKSSVCVWVRDIELTAEQQTVLSLRRPHEKGKHKGALVNRNNGLARRKQYQEAGRIKARERDQLHLAGCMLYWAEGAKRKNSLIFCNSDPEMIHLFVKFLRNSLSVADNDIKVRIVCYLGNGFSVGEIETYWLDLLQLSEPNFERSTVNLQPKSSQQKGRKLIYGVCTIAVYNTKVVQHVFGAIQEYAGVEKSEWLF